MHTPILHILIDSDGTPRTINQQVKVHMIAQHHQQGASADDIATFYHITLADVYGALAYYYDNQAFFEQRQHDLEAPIEQAKAFSQALSDKIKGSL